MSVRASCELVDDAIETPRAEDPVPSDDRQVTGPRILRKIGNGHRSADRAGRRQGLAGEDPGEGGLAGAVASDEPDPVPGRDLEGHRLEELATAGGELEVRGGDHRTSSVKPMSTLSGP